MYKYFTAKAYSTNNKVVNNYIIIINYDKYYKYYSGTKLLLGSWMNEYY